MSRHLHIRNNRQHRLMDSQPAQNTKSIRFGTTGKVSPDSQEAVSKLIQRQLRSANSGHWSRSVPGDGRHVAAPARGTQRDERATGTENPTGGSACVRGRPETALHCVRGADATAGGEESGP